MLILFFQLTHMDVWGPYHTITSTGVKYFLTIVDDRTRTTWVFLMPTKTSSFVCFYFFLNSIVTQFSTSVKSIKTDNDGEFISSSFKIVLDSLGIMHQLSCPYTPQQNSRVEHKHRHLLNIARALRFHSGLPLKYWGECGLAATHLINIQLTHVLNYKNPFELLHNKPPDYTLLKIFRCLLDCFCS